jgi:hypothetical protein
MSQQVSQKSGLDIHLAEKALLFLAPIVLARLQRTGAAPPATGAPTGTAQPQGQTTGGIGGVLEEVAGKIFGRGST